jgi:DUF4097 and DUF4098 domain-containing protein YvlB
MERNYRFATWTGAVMGISLAVLLNVALARGADDNAAVTEEFHHTYALTANGKIALQNINGSVHISVWDQNEVKVDAVKRAHSAERLKDAEIQVDSNPDSISIETHYRQQDRQQDESWHNGHNNPASVEYTLTVPRNARLDEIKLINGNLDVNGLTGEVRASCINGKLTARGLAGQVKLATINGPLEATFEHLPAASMELTSVNGPVELTVPSDAKASVEASTVSGSIDNDFGLRTNDHRYVGHDLRGELGGGGAEIRLSNVNGTIHLNHAKDGRTLSPARNTSRNDEGDSI